MGAAIFISVKTSLGNSLPLRPLAIAGCDPCPLEEEMWVVERPQEWIEAEPKMVRDGR